MEKLSAAAIIPFYNTDKKYFCELLTSLKAQTRLFDEVIIVNDGSTDTIALHLLEDERFKNLPLTVLHQGNSGVAKTLTRGAQKAGSDIIFEVDSDDILLPTYVERYMEIFESDTSIDGITSSYKLFFDGEDWTHENAFHRLYTPTGLHFPELFFQNCAGGQNSAFRKSALKKIGYWDPQFTSMQDWGIWLQFLEHNLHQEIIQEPLYLYRVHKNGLAQRAGQKEYHLDENLASAMGRVLHGNSAAVSVEEYRTQKDIFLKERRAALTQGSSMPIKKVLAHFRQYCTEFLMLLRREGLVKALRRLKNFLLYGKGFE